jgi:uncharacterized membrane protein YdjX (TVP38/TMEM64 family)
MRYWRPLALVGWGCLLVVGLILWRRAGIPLRETPAHLDVWLRDFGFARAALLYIIIYTLRPLLLFPATLMTLASGMVFGWFWGTVFTVIGENFSANFAFWLARRIGRDWVAEHETERVQRWGEKLRRHGIETVVLLRLLYLPFDGVNFGCGLTAMRQRDFAVGTFIGILPAIVMVVAVGGAANAHAGNRPLMLVISAVLLLLTVAGARLLRRHERALDEEEN